VLGTDQALVFKKDKALIAKYAEECYEIHGGSSVI